MKRKRNALTVLAIAAVMVLGSTLTAVAQRPNTRDVTDAVRSLNSKLEDFEYNLRFQMRSSSQSRDQLSEVSEIIRKLRESISQFESNLGRRRENRDDVNRIVDPARSINEFLTSNPQNRRVEDDWQGVRTQIDRLGANYGVTPNWEIEEAEWVKDDREPFEKAPVTYVGLSGTYELDMARSESVDDIISNARLGPQQREDLKDKLVAPGQISLDIRGNEVTLSSSDAEPATFTADGRETTERSPTGRTVRMRATINGDVLTVSSLGGESDYTVTFTSISNGSGLKVSRRITTEYLAQTVFAESIYNKTGTAAVNSGGRNDSYDPNGGYSDNDQPNVPYGGTGNTTGGRPTVGGPRPGNYVVPNGVILTGVLENEINTKASQNNDKFRMTVQSPNEFRGAHIDGYITGVERSGKITGRSNITFNFEKITLRNGRTYDFAGFLQSITDQSGKTIKVDNEGSVQGDSQTKQTAKRGGIGAALGAVIGAIAGGGKGAAIGAIIGGGAGAGSVVVQGREDIVLQQGSTITVTASSPIQSTRRQDR